MLAGPPIANSGAERRLIELKPATRRTGASRYAHFQASLTRRDRLPPRSVGRGPRLISSHRSAMRSSPRSAAVIVAVGSGLNTGPKEAKRGRTFFGWSGNVAGNISCTVTSRPATLSVVQDTTPPTVARILPAPGSVVPELQQYPDVSYGRDQLDPGLTGYFAQSTPGGPLPNRVFTGSKRAGCDGEWAGRSWTSGACLGGLCRPRSWRLQPGLKPGLTRLLAGLKSRPGSPAPKREPARTRSRRRRSGLGAFPWLTGVGFCLVCSGATG